MNLLDPLTGTEALTQSGRPIEPGFLTAFWGWGFSALDNPLLRGYLAEFLVYRALFNMPTPDFKVPTSHFSTKMEGDVHDLVFFMNDEKFTIQVKSKDSYSKSQVFDTSFAEGFDCVSNSPLPAEHWSDFYIFAYLALDNKKCQENERLHDKWNPNPSRALPMEKARFKLNKQALVKSVLELDNWSFYILDREQLRGQKSINLNKLRSKVNKGEAVWVQHDAIADALVGFALERHAKRCDEML
ncbi:hypothetical protein N0U25_08330 [Pseudomonas sivasensis]|uniref:hypothetical protein n=1 Tax=Pseudomonas sivasensis TaxID=1880678 RepID=UPI0021AAF910|nr:hypothetical protein [Pseudomonas sivasensis]MCT4497797.1 hypothetical protein [Pseudomonas sivasensis]